MDTSNIKKIFNSLERFDMKYIAGKPQRITIMAIIIITKAKCNSYLTIMNLKIDHFQVEMSEALKINGQIHKLIINQTLERKYSFS